MCDGRAQGPVIQLLQERPARIIPYEDDAAPLEDVPHAYEE
jgi:hypothetical protein